MTFNNNKSMYLHPVSENVIIKYIQTVKSNRASGVDGIRSFMIKRKRWYIVQVLVHIINLIRQVK